MKRETLDALLAARAEKRAMALVYDLNTGQHALVYAQVAAGDFGLAPEMLAEVRRRIRDDRSGRVETPSGEPLFVQVLNPPLRMVLVGAVHIAQALAPMAALAGYAVTVVDPRRAFNTDTRFPDVRTRDDWPDEALAEMAPDGRTAIITLTHDPKLDDPALEVALRSDAFYIGSLGSKKTHAARLKRLTALGFDDDALARIHGPVGLALGAVSPAEIAIAIMAQVTAALHGKDTRPASGQMAAA